MSLGSLFRISPLHPTESPANRPRAIYRACFETLETRRLLSFGPPANHPTVGTPSAIATADFNNDGKLDLATCANAGEGSVSVLMGNGAGGFAAAQRTVVGSQLSSIAVADFDSDNNTDIVIADTANSALHFLQGNGDGTFQPAVTRQQWAFVSAVAVGNFNNDGHADLLVTLWRWDDWWNIYQVQLGNGQGVFGDSDQYPSSMDPTSAGPGTATGDVNNDG
jgi:hypothetical protein